MQTLNFSIAINKPKELVWKTMLEKPSYQERTSTFCEWSTYEGSREQWAKIRFVDPKGYGMISEIAENKLYEFISIRHLGEILIDEKTGKSKETMYPKPWYENYSFSEADGITTVGVFMDNLPDDYIPMFQEMRPKALKRLKEICEA